jgi:uncharacterized membrane protein
LAPAAECDMVLEIAGCMAKGETMRLFAPSLALALAFVMVAGSASAQLGPARFQCAGSEPFWSLEISASGTAKFAAPDSELAASGTSFTGRMSVVQNRHPAAWMWRGAARPGAPELVAAITPASCEEPSGEKLPYTVWLALPNGRAVAGCCRQ